MNQTQFDVSTFNVSKYDEILERGLSNGIGERESQMCIEAAICTVLDLPHGDDPQCVAYSVRRFKICLNDKNWSNPEARAKGLRDLGLAQLGSLGVIDNKTFVTLLAIRTVNTLLYELLKELKYSDELIQLCKEANTLKQAKDAALKVKVATYSAAAAYAADAAAAYAAAAATYSATAAAAAADAAAYAAAAYATRNKTDKYLILSAEIALSILKDLKSPGCALL